MPTGPMWTTAETAPSASRARNARPARDVRARNVSPVPAKPARASASAARGTVPARREGSAIATATVATVTARTIREEGHKMASQNEIVWKKDLDGHPVGTGDPCHKDEDLHRPFCNGLRQGEENQRNGPGNSREPAGRSLLGKLLPGQLLPDLSGVSVVPDLPGMPKVPDLSGVPNVPGMPEVPVLHDPELQLRLQLQLLG